MENAGVYRNPDRFRRRERERFLPRTKQARCAAGPDDRCLGFSDEPHGPHTGRLAATGCSAGRRRLSEGRAHDGSEYHVRNVAIDIRPDYLLHGQDKRGSGICRGIDSAAAESEGFGGSCDPEPARHGIQFDS